MWLPHSTMGVSRSTVMPLMVLHSSRGKHVVVLVRLGGLRVLGVHGQHAIAQVLPEQVLVVVALGLAWVRTECTLSVAMNVGRRWTMKSLVYHMRLPTSGCAVASPSMRSA